MKKIFIPLALVWLGQAALAQNNVTVDFEDIALLPGSINSDMEESKPVVSGDGKHLYFVRSGSKGTLRTQQIWYSTRKNDTEWTEPTEFQAFNELQHNAVVGVSDDGKRLYLMNYYSTKGPRQTGISYSYYHPDSLWMRPKPIRIPQIENFGSYNDYYLTPDESVLLISIKSEGSRGQEDLYVCLKDIDGSWRGPVNLGPVINTKGYEISPFLAEDGKTLFFSTNGRKDGKGGADIYYSQRLDNSWTNWSQPVNLGDKINSEGFDAYMIVTPQREVMFSSTRSGEQAQIYAGKIIGTLGEDPLKALGRNGFNSTCGDICDELNKLKARVEQLENLNRMNMDNYNERNLEYIYFAFDSYVLTDSAKLTLDHIATFLKEHPAYRVMFVGHTDSKGNHDYNMKLSEKRCLAAEDYLERQGISDTRIYNKAYGKEKLLEDETPGDEDENRRVEIFFLK